jgi:hypothetical protein
MSVMNEEDEEEILFLKKIADELEAIKVYARFQARDAIITALNKVATTPERQQMWRLFDGNVGNEQIAEQVGVSLRSVQYFAKEAEDAGLVMTEKRGYPKRIEDVIPSEWKAWKPKKAKRKKLSQPEEDSGVKNDA